MKMKMKLIPFDLERAKRITNGEEPGRVVTYEGATVRLLCFDRETHIGPQYPIVGLMWEPDMEYMHSWTDTGRNACYHPSDEETDMDLRLEVPDFLACEFKPFDKVLVRRNGGEWLPNLFAFVDADSEYNSPYCCVFGSWEQCIPFNEETEHLVGTADNCEE